MSGCMEGILVDLSEPIEENSPFSVSDSIECLREENLDRRDSLQVPEQLLLDIRVTKSLNHSNRDADVLLDSPPFSTIDAETFDFDLPVTPVTISDRSTSTEDEEEVFFGPVSHIERCVATAVTSATKENKPLSPLDQRQMAEIFKEANAVANRIGSAAGPKKGRAKNKQNLLCVKQLNLNKSVFSPKAVKKLLNSVSKNRTSDDEENDKENCDTEAGDKLPLQDISPKSDSKSSSKSSESEGDNSDTPSKRHNRSGTYTLNKTPLDLLPEEKRRSLPVVKSMYGGSAGKTKLDVPERKDESGKRSASKLQQPSTKLARVRTSIPGVQSMKKTTKTGSPEADIQTKPRSRLSAPRAGSIPSKTSALPSKLKPVGSGKVIASSIPCKGQLPQKSGLPAKGVPTTKLQLMKPSGLQRPSGQKNGGDSVKKAGPMKAFNPISQQEAEPVVEEATPSKVDKRVQRKNLLSSSFSTPSKTGSTSSMDSPASVSKRRSFLPTPSKARFGSCGSIPSPSGSRASSTSSCKSLESPLVTASGRHKRPSGGSQSTSKYGGVDHIDDTSPSAMKSRRPLVTNTPNMPRKKISAWSPIQRKKPIDMAEEATMCTKKIKR